MALVNPEGGNTLQTDKYIGICHFDVNDFVVTPDLQKVIFKSVAAEQSASPRPTPTMTAQNALSLPATLPIAWPTARKPRGAVLCPCTEGDVLCGDDMSAAGMTVNPPADVTSAWYQNICALSVDKLKIFARESVAVHRRHFLAEDIIEEKASFGQTRLTSRDGVAPQRTSVIAETARVRADGASTVGSIASGFSQAMLRSAAAFVNTTSGSKGVKAHHIEQLIDRHLAEGFGAAGRSASPVVDGSRVVVGEVDDDMTDIQLDNVSTALRRSNFDIVKAISSDCGWGPGSGVCDYYTGFDGFQDLVAIFEYMNADGAFDRLRMYRTDFKGDEDDGASGASVRSSGPARALPTPFDQFLFWIVVFRRFRGSGMLEHASNLFGISYSTALRLYTTWTIAVGRFFQGQHHPATRRQARDAASAHAMACLGLDKGMCAFIGDCTERWVQDPDSGALHSALYSQYKGRTTIKYLVITTSDSYISFISRPANGACTDNGLHIISDVPKLL